MGSTPPSPRSKQRTTQSEGGDTATRCAAEQCTERAHMSKLSCRALQALGHRGVQVRSNTDTEALLLPFFMQKLYAPGVLAAHVGEAVCLFVAVSPDLAWGGRRQPGMHTVHMEIVDPGRCGL